MAKLLIKTPGFDARILELRLGPNVIGRNPDTDFSIPHPTISSVHCEFILMENCVTVRDLESTNGTFVDGKPVREAKLIAGQIVRLGDVELIVESIEPKINIPKFINPEIPAPPVVLMDGSIVCPRHPLARATHRCTHCMEIMCELCVHRMRRRGGKTALLLCPICSHNVEPIDPELKPKKKSFLARVGETVRLKFTRAIHVRGQ